MDTIAQHNSPHANLTDGELNKYHSVACTSVKQSVRSVLFFQKPRFAGCARGAKQPALSKRFSPKGGLSSVKTYYNEQSWVDRLLGVQNGS